MKRSDKKTVLAIVGVILVVAVFIWLGFSGFNDSVYTTITPIEQGDTRVQQSIDFQADNITKKYYIHTRIEVYNSGWKKAEEWHDYARADEIVNIKVMRRLQAEEKAVKIGKAIREFHYGKESK